MHQSQRMLMKDAGHPVLQFQIRQGTTHTIGQTIIMNLAAEAIIVNRGGLEIIEMMGLLVLTRVMAHLVILRDMGVMITTPATLVMLQRLEALPLEGPTQREVEEAVSFLFHTHPPGIPTPNLIT